MCIRDSKTHVKRQDFLKFLASLNLNKYRNLKSGRPRVQEDQIIITLNLKSEDNQDELPLDFTFAKTEAHLVYLLILNSKLLLFDLLGL